MSPQPYSSKIAQRAGLIIALLIGVEACMDKEFDLTKPINKQLNVHANFDLWLGSTDTLRLDDPKLMGSLDSGLLVLNDDGSYSMKMSGEHILAMPTFDLTLTIPANSSHDSVDIDIDVDLEESIDIVSPPDMGASVKLPQFPPMLPGMGFLPIAFTITAQDTSSTTFDVNFGADEFPEQVNIIHEIAFGDYDGNSGNGSLVSFTIDLTGMHSTIGVGNSSDLEGYGFRDTIKLLAIKFPSVFQLALNLNSPTKDYENLIDGEVLLANCPVTDKDSVVLNFYVKSLKTNFQDSIKLHDSISTRLSYSLQNLPNAELLLVSDTPSMPLKFNIAGELKFKDVEVTTKPIEVPVDGNAYEVASGLVDIPPQITCVNEVDFGSASYLAFSVFSSGLPFDVQSGEIPIEFPKVLQFAEEQNNLTKDPATERWTYHLQATQTFGREVFHDSLRLAKLDINTGTLSGTEPVMLIDDNISMAGGTIVLAPKRTWANRLLHEILATKFQFNFELHERQLKPYSVTACLADNVVEAQHFSFPLDLPDLLRGDSVNLALQSPGIAFVVVNPLSVPLTIDLAVGDGMGNIESDEMHIAAATGIGLPATSHIYMTGTGVLPPGYEDYELVNINVVDIIKSVPDSVVISATPRIDNNQGAHTIYLAGVQDDTFKMHYDVDVPLAFDAGFRFVFTDTIPFDSIDLSKYNVNGTVE
ncbi:MAG: hypothetical protein LBS94_02320, partial [Prevotellaceae bacterium]|nr:hypothetical protein [Prevotellaceae bacterium]